MMLYFDDFPYAVALSNDHFVLFFYISNSAFVTQTAEIIQLSRIRSICSICIYITYHSTVGPYSQLWTVQSPQCKQILLTQYIIII